MFSSSCALPWYLWTSDTHIYWMAMTTSVLALSLHLAYQMSYNDSPRSCHHYYYINLDVCINFLSDGHSYFLSLRHSVSNSCRWLCHFPLPWMTMSFVWLTPSHLFIICLYVGPDQFFFWIRPCIYFQQNPWLRSVPYVDYMCYHLMLTSHNVISNIPCRALVKKYEIMCSVLQ